MIEVRQDSRTWRRGGGNMEEGVWWRRGLEETWGGRYLYRFPPPLFSTTDLPPCSLHLPSKPEYPITFLSQSKQYFPKTVLYQNQTFLIFPPPTPLLPSISPSTCYLHASPPSQTFLHVSSTFPPNQTILPPIEDSKNSGFVRQLHIPKPHFTYYNFYLQSKTCSFPAFLQTPLLSITFGL